ncbi:MAG: tRNA-binding protein [Fidelibacterota bacterium]
MINIKTFSNLELRIGTILKAEEFPEAKKPAFKLEIDFGPFGIKWSSAQIVGNYSLEGLQGRKIVAIFNLGTKRIATFTSEVLVLGVPDANGEVVLLEPDGDIPDGSRVN